MAITGSGTQADPWIAQNYTDLQQAFSTLSSVGGTKYLELGNDINCNDYGSSFVWNALSVGGSSNRAMIFDLKGHTIKNVSIASGSTMFTFAGAAQSIVKNGKILNVFFNGSNGFCNYIGGLYSHSKLVNVSFSANATGINNNLFYCGFDSCAIYVEGGQKNKDMFRIPSTVSAKAINTDFLFNNAATSILFIDTSTGSIQDCRIRGSVDNLDTVMAVGNNVFKNCVIDLETDYIKLIEQTGNACTGVINTEKLPSNFNRAGMTAVNSSEIINGDSLRAKNFAVVNVVGG